MVSTWQSQDEQETQSPLTIQDANPFCRLLWVVTAAPEESVLANSVTLEQIGTLAMTVDKKMAIEDNQNQRQRQRQRQRRAATRI